jgi:hypothetical protein
MSFDRAKSPNESNTMKGTPHISIISAAQLEIIIAAANGPANVVLIPGSFEPTRILSSHEDIDPLGRPFSMSRSTDTAISSFPSDD